MRRRCMRLAAYGLLAAATACQMIDRIAPTTEAPPPVPGAARTAADELVAYLARLRGINEAGLAAEVARQRQFAATDPTDLARLKAALALSLSPQAEESDILTLVDPVVRKENADPDARAVASFLQALAMERRRLKEGATAARTGLQSERRALEAQKQRADALQERAAQLQQKLDALTALEKSLSDRPPPSR
jgi:hypothetical protein